MFLPLVAWYVNGIIPNPNDPRTKERGFVRPRFGLADQGTLEKNFQNQGKSGHFWTSTPITASPRPNAGPSTRPWTPCAGSKLPELGEDRAPTPRGVG